MANLLQYETSPYLLQHAHNPVNWRPWNEESLALAKSQHKLILVSIGYSACHWCHVMEKQCFENEAAARLMNKYFICIKVDREERPDVDAVYMNALQMMNGQGGWPLNCFALPDGRPVYGGTYFPLEKWMAVLENLQHLFETNTDTMEHYASKLLQGIEQSQLFKVPEHSEINYRDVLQKSIENWVKHFDYEDGGTTRVPKFPMPCNYNFLLHFGTTYKHHEVLNHVYITLNKMCMGGIFDQLGGGFARYSTDGIWKVPHFEKMLYDNAQLVSLYSKAYVTKPEQLYKEVIIKTLNFIHEEWSNAEGAYFSALDADSEGTEGKYYIWNETELRTVLQANFDLFSRYYHIDEYGYWEHDHYILIRTKSDEEFCHEEGMALDTLKDTLKICQQQLLAYRSKRVKPGLDDKVLCSWNALMVKAYIDAFVALQDSDYLEKALKGMLFITQQCSKQFPHLYHHYNKGNKGITGFLEDYAFTLEAMVDLYKVSGNEDWLQQAMEMTAYVVTNFYDENDGLFYFNSKQDRTLFTQHKEVQDNVIPSSNAAMAHVLYDLGIYFENSRYVQMAQKMAAYFYREVAQFGSAYAHWALLLFKLEQPLVQAAIPIKEFKDTVVTLRHSGSNLFFPYAMHEHSKLPFIMDKKEDQRFYLCYQHVCGLPLNNQNELITAFKNINP